MTDPEKIINSFSKRLKHVHCKDIRENILEKSRNR